MNQQDLRDLMSQDLRRALLEKRDHGFHVGNVLAPHARPKLRLQVRRRECVVAALVLNNKKREREPRETVVLSADSFRVL